MTQLQPLGPCDMDTLRLADYDFLDFGASSGGSIDFARDRLAGRRGLGIDIDPKKVAVMREAGYDCIEGDILSLELPPQSVRFVVLSHVLEHLPGLAEVEAAIASAAQVATNFIFIRGPFFDADAYLESVGVRLYWSNWSGHLCHLTLGALRRVLLRQNLDHHVVLLRGPIRGSDHAAVHSLASAVDQTSYDPDIHPPKPRIEFGTPVFEEFLCFVRLRPFAEWDELVRRERRGRDIYYEPSGYHDVRRLNWGCGMHAEPGWINSDVKEGPGIDISCDIRDGLPLEDASIDYAVSIHALPEVPYSELIPVLQELRRVLKPGGVLRLALPDLDKGVDAYRRGDREYFQVPDDEWQTVGGKLATQLVWYGYSRTVFVRDFVEELLRKAGFADIRHVGYRETTTEYPEIIDLDNRENESLFVEAVK